MKEITRVHLAKTAYDIEVAAKKQLEKYINSLESYTQDADVLSDVEIRMTELLAERGIMAGGVIATDDIAALRSQLGEPYEFADDGGDIAVGSMPEPTTRRLYRSTDDAVLGGVLSGVAAYFKVNPLWTRLVFILVLVISFGFATLVYILFWIMTPAARTVTEKLQLAGKEVTVESIKALNIDEDRAPHSRIAPFVQNFLAFSFGTLAALAAIGTFAATAWAIIAALTVDESFVAMSNRFAGLGEGNVWLVWLLFWVVIAGLLLLTALFSLIAYALFTKKLTKRLVVSGVVIIMLGITSVATVVGIGSTQSLRVANESRAMVRETTVTLPKEFAAVTAVTFERTAEHTMNNQPVFGPSQVTVRYIVDEGPARYELRGLPSAKTKVTLTETAATVSLEIPESFRNSFVQPELTVYGPALQTITTKEATNITYNGQKQAAMSLESFQGSYLTLNGTYDQVQVRGSGSVDLNSSTVGALAVAAEYQLSVSAGTVRELVVQQPDICPSDAHYSNTGVTVAGVTAGEMTYNGVKMPAKTHKTGCASVEVGDSDDSQDYLEDDVQ